MIAEYEKKIAANARVQVAVNMSEHFGYRTMLEMIRSQFYAQHADHRQYDGHVDGREWSVVKMSQDLTTKGGEHFKRGDVAMVSEHHDGIFGTRFTFYSIRTGMLVRTMFLPAKRFTKPESREID